MASIDHYVSQPWKNNTKPEFYKITRYELVKLLRDDLIDVMSKARGCNADRTRGTSPLLCDVSTAFWCILNYKSIPDVTSALCSNLRRYSFLVHIQPHRPVSVLFRKILTVPQGHLAPSVICTQHTVSTLERRGQEACDSISNFLYIAQSITNAL
jgi:hypothetical protein